MRARSSHIEFALSIRRATPSSSVLGPREQAHDEHAGAREVEEEAGCTSTPCCSRSRTQSASSSMASGSSSTAYQPPSRSSTRRSGSAGASLAQRPSFAVDALADLPLHGAAQPEQRRGRVLHGGAHREIGVGDELEPLAGPSSRALRAGERDPAELQLREPRQLREAREREGERAPRGGEARLAGRAAPVVEEDLVGDQREPAARAERFQPGALVGLHDRSRWDCSDARRRRRACAARALASSASRSMRQPRSAACASG